MRRFVLAACILAFVFLYRMIATWWMLRKLKRSLITHFDEAIREEESKK